MMARGPGLIAGSPTASGSPGRVTVPTPGPARKRTPEPDGAGCRRARTMAPWVASGSSPASFRTPTQSPVSASGKEAFRPRGRSIATGSGSRPVSRRSQAARAAAAAQAPVVQPRLNSVIAAGL